MGRSIALCEADNEVRRIKEELELLPQEMRAHLRYLQQLLATQSNIEAALLAAEQVPAAQLEAAAGGVVAAGYVQLGGTGRYQASAVQLLESGRAVSGALSYVRLGGLEAQQLLSRSLRLFGSLQVDGVLNGHVDAEQEEPDSEGSGYAPDSDDEVIAVTA